MKDGNLAHLYQRVYLSFIHKTTRGCVVSKIDAQCFNRTMTRVLASQARTCEIFLHESGDAPVLSYSIQNKYFSFTKCYLLVCTLYILRLNLIVVEILVRLKSFQDGKGYEISDLDMRNIHK